MMKRAVIVATLFCVFFTGCSVSGIETTRAYYFNEKILSADKMGECAVTSVITYEEADGGTLEVTVTAARKGEMYYFGTSDDAASRGIVHIMTADGQGYEVNYDEGTYCIEDGNAAEMNYDEFFMTFEERQSGFENAKALSTDDVGSEYIDRFDVGSGMSKEEYTYVYDTKKEDEITVMVESGDLYVLYYEGLINYINNGKKTYVWTEKIKLSDTVDDSLFEIPDGFTEKEQEGGKANV